MSEDDQLDEKSNAFADERQIEINKKLTEMAASDPSFRELLNTNPDEAFEKAGVTEQAQELLAESAEAAGEEVSAHGIRRRTYYRTCYWVRYGYWWHQG